MGLLNARWTLFRRRIATACGAGQLVAIGALLRAGASPAAADDDGRTPASEAEEMGDPELVAALGLAA